MRVSHLMICLKPWLRMAGWVARPGNGGKVEPGRKRLPALSRYEARTEIEP
jgi:hypothetical protein